MNRKKKYNPPFALFEEIETCNILAASPHIGDNTGQGPIPDFTINEGNGDSEEEDEDLGG